MPPDPPRGSRSYLITPLNKYCCQYEHSSKNLSYGPVLIIFFFYIKYFIFQIILLFCLMWLHCTWNTCAHRPLVKKTGSKTSTWQQKLRKLEVSWKMKKLEQINSIDSSFSVLISNQNVSKKSCWLRENTSRYYSVCSNIQWLTQGCCNLSPSFRSSKMLLLLLLQ